MVGERDLFAMWILSVNVMYALPFGMARATAHNTTLNCASRLTNNALFIDFRIMRREHYTRATDVLYKLTTIYYQGKSEARYPRFDVRREVTGYFHSLEDAEWRIRK